MSNESKLETNIYKQTIPEETKYHSKFSLNGQQNKLESSYRQGLQIRIIDKTIRQETQETLFTPKSIHKTDQRP